jgi:quinone-modifying oxidoreductase subunit QmoA
MTDNSVSSDLLVVGGGIAGITAAVEAAETGLSVTLVEKNSFIGGKVAQFNQYFPKLCPPSCGLEINIRRLRTNPSVKLFTLAEVTKVEKVNGKQRAEVRLNPRYVNDLCTACGECVKVCPEERANEFNYGMNKTKAIYIPDENSYPAKYIIDMKSCKGTSCNKCVDVCKYNAIDLNDTEKSISVEANAIVWATGWEPYDANKLDILGFGEFPDVVTNVMMERIAAPNGPTKGQILRPSTKEKINSVAFVQCAGSRDEDHLEYCSSICCLASLKQAKYIREQNPDADIHFHYIDIRANGLLEEFYNSVKEDEKLHFHRGKVAKVIKDASSDKLIVEAEDSLTGNLIQNKVEMVVLATGMEPSDKNLPVDKSLIDKNGFLKSNVNGIIGCGVSTKPKEVAAAVQEATGTVLKAINTIRGN